MDEREKQVALDCMCAWLLWVLAMGLTVGGTIVGLVQAESDRGRIVAVSLFAVAVLALGGACTMTIHVFMRRQTAYWIAALRLAREGDAGRPLRQIR